MSHFKVFNIQPAELNHPKPLPELYLAYQTYGKLNKRKDNAILFPTYFTGTHQDNERLIGSGRALDSDRYFIVVPNMIGNGQSSSPSNTVTPFNGANFPKFTIHHNIIAQAQLLEHLQIRGIKLALGWSMGGLQVYHWCVHQPKRIENALIICATAKASEHNIVFLEGVKAALCTDAEFNNGHYNHPPTAGLKAFGRVYAGWAYSQAYFRHQRYRDMGFNCASELLDSWAQDHLNYDANDLLCALDTWQNADIGTHPLYKGNTVEALKSIESNVWLMPCEQDLYFRHEDNRGELTHLRHGRYMGYESDFGHCSAGPGRFKTETAMIEKNIKAILENAWESAR